MGGPPSILTLKRLGDRFVNLQLRQTKWEGLTNSRRVDRDRRAGSIWTYQPSS